MKDSRISVVFLTNSLHGGGAERSLLEVFHAVDRRIFDVSLWRLSQENFYPEYLSASSSTEVLPPLTMTDKDLPKFKSLAGMLPDYLGSVYAEEFLGDGLRVQQRFAQTRRLITNPVIFVCSQLSMNVRGAVFQWLSNYDHPLIFIEQNEPHTRYSFGESEAVRNLAWARIRKLYPWATHVVAVSRTVKRSLMTRFGIDPRRVSVIPNPVNLDRFQPLATTKASPPHEFYRGRTPVLLCVSRFTVQKNHHLLLRSFARVRQKMRLKLILLGQGPLKEAIRRTTYEMNLAKDVAILDFQADLRDYLAHADLLLLSSYCEGHSLALLEALACGTPVVSTNWPGVAEVVHQRVNGVICQANDAALAAGIMAGLRLAKTKGVGSKLVDSVRRFGVHKVAQKYEKLFMEIARQNWLTRTEAAQAASVGQAKE